jgi:hypothetical protein
MQNGNFLTGDKATVLARKSILQKKNGFFYKSMSEFFANEHFILVDQINASEEFIMETPFLEMETTAKHISAWKENNGFMKTLISPLRNQALELFL